MENFAGFAYLVASLCFIMALRGLSSPVTARQGNFFGIAGMVIAVVTTLAKPEVVSYEMIVVGVLIGGAIGTFTALKIQMTALPQLVAAFHSLVGLAAVFVAAAAFYNPSAYGLGQSGEIAVASLLEIGLGTAIGAITFTGSIVAFGKLQGVFRSAPITFRGQHPLNALLGLALIAAVVWFCREQTAVSFWVIVGLSLLIGYLLIIPIGGADMPVVVSMLNSYSGWAACGIGFTLANTALIVTGALVGASGAILSYIMCKGMNRSFFSVILGGFGAEEGSGSGGASGEVDDRPVKSGAPADAAYFMKTASSVIIVPGYGMAVAQAQHALREMADALKAEGVKVSYAIHPVAGRMPGHMNVLLAEANVPYDEVFELEDINSAFKTADVAFVIGANDVTNPAAKTDPDSAIYGMPILDVEDAGQVYFIKRSMASGYAGVQNELFFRENTTMLFGDAKAITEAVVKGID